MQIDNEKNKMENLINIVFNNEKLIHIFTDLFWGIIKFKEKKNTDSLKNLGECCEHSHKVLFLKLRRVMSEKIYLDFFPKTRDWEVNEKLQNEIFPPLGIDNIDLLKLTREIVLKWNEVKHEFKRGSYSNFKTKEILTYCISSLKLFLIMVQLFRKVKKIKQFKIESEFPLLFDQNENEVINIFLDIVFTRKFRNLLFQKSILDLNDVSNSRVLQIYIPFYVFSHLRIEIILLKTSVYPFRPVGPYLIDFEKGNWIYVSINARFIKKLLEIMEKSILLSAMSGTGKTVISRWIGYRFYKKGYSVFYIDCLELKAGKVESILDQILILNEKNPLNNLFIFENIHILDDDLKNKLVKCKDKTLCLITERVFEEVGEKNGDFYNKFMDYQKIQLSINHWSFKKTIKGIINLNSKYDMVVTNQLKYIGNQNLWIYAIILKLFQEFSDFKQGKSIIKIFADHQLIGEKISDYFQNLLCKKPIKILSSEEAKYLNHINYFLGILSIFSEYEMWVEENFFNYLFSIKDESPLGLYNSKIRINEETLKKVQAFLIDNFEIKERTVNVKPGIKQKEFKIPHSQMAIIYRNTILSVIEKSYPGLQDNIFNLYVFQGNYYGHLLNNKYAKISITNNQESLQGEVFSFMKCKQYTAIGNMDLFLSKFLESIKNHSLRELNIFIEGCLYSKIIYDDEKEYVYTLLDKLVILNNYFWEQKINRTNPRNLYYFLESLRDYLGSEYFIQFFERFNSIILKKMSEAKLDLIIKLMFSLFKESESMIQAYRKDLKQLILRNKEPYNNFISSITFIENFEKITQAHIHIRTIIEKKLNQYLFSSDLKTDNLILSRSSGRRGLFLSIYYDFLEKVIGEIKITQMFKEKLFKSNLGQFYTFIINLADHKSETTNKIVDLFFEDIKLLFEKSDLKNISELLIEIRFYNELVDGFKNLLFENWDWFLNLISKFNAFDIMYHYQSISKGFLEIIDTRYRNKFDFFIKSIIIDKVRDYHKLLVKKYEIYKLLIKNDLLTQIKDEIYSLFTISINNILKNPSNKLDNIYIVFKEFQSNSSAFSIFTSDYNFSFINSNNEFKQFVVNGKENSLFKLMSILENNTHDWFKSFIETHSNFLKEKYGNKYEVAHLCSREGREYLKEIPYMVKNLDIESINAIYNSTFRMWYPIKHSIHATDLLIKVHDAFLREINQNISSHQNLFLSNDMSKKLATIDSITLFNFIIILDKFHPDLLQKIYNQFQQIILTSLRGTPINTLILIGIFEIFQFSIFNLKRFSNTFLKKGFLPELLNSSIRNLDLFSLRVYTSYLSNSYLTRKERSDEIELLKEKMNFKRSFNNSKLLHIALALHRGSISLLKKPAALLFFKGQRQTRQIRLDPKEFEALTTAMDFTKDDKQKELTHISLNNFPFDEDIILKTPIFYTDFILEKIKDSNLHDISQYFETLASWVELDDRLLSPPLEFLKYFNSDLFSKTVKKANIEDVFYFFEVFLKLYPKIANKLWEKHHNYFKKEKFVKIIKEMYYKHVFEFYTLRYRDLSQIPFDIIEIIKKSFRNHDVAEIILILADFDEENLEFHLDNFKDDIKDIIQKSSRQEVVHALQQYSLSKNKEKLEVIYNKLPYIETKKKERYFFE